jgi:hypothetical protein
MTFTEADSILARRAIRKVAHNTHLHRVDADTIAVRLHSTDVVTLHRDGRAVLSSDGWRTVTTKERLNRFAPCRVYQQRGEWFVQHGGDTVPFRDGLQIATA